MDRFQLAEALMQKATRHEEAVAEAKELTTHNLAHRLSSTDLSPPLNKYQLRAYMAEAERRVRKAEGFVGGAD